MAQTENNIRPIQCRWINTNKTDKFYIYSYEIEYSNKTKRTLQVRTNRSSVVIDNGEKNRQLVQKLKELGVFEYDFPHQIVDLQTLVERNGELKTLELLKEEHNAQSSTDDSKVEPRQFLYKGFDDSGLFDKYTVEIHYSNGQKKEFVVNANKGSVSIFNDGNMRMQLISKITDIGAFDYNTPHTMINVGTLVVRNGELKTLEELQKQQQNNNHNNGNGKHYVISDIHGMLGSYMDAIRKINSNDSLFILGDAADRGKYGIDILFDIMQRQGENGKKPQVTYMLGNHDATLIQGIEIFNKYNLSTQEIMDFMNERSYTGSLKFITGITMRDYQKRGEQIPSSVKAEEAKYKKAIEEIKKKTDVVRKQKGITESEIRTLTIWLNSNGGLPTANRYLQLPKEKQDELYEFLVNSPVFLGKKIGGQNACSTSKYCK